MSNQIDNFITTFPVPRIYQNLSLSPAKRKGEDTVVKTLRIYESDKEGEKNFHTISGSSSSSSISTTATKLSVTCPDVLEASC